MPIFTLAPLKKMLKDIGAKRVSLSAAEEMSRFLEKRTTEICVEAKKLAEHSGRRTVMRNDIKMSLKRLKDEHR